MRCSSVFFYLCSSVSICGLIFVVALVNVSASPLNSIDKRKLIRAQEHLGILFPACECALRRRRFSRRRFSRTAIITGRQEIEPHLHLSVTGVAAEEQPVH